MSLSTPNLQSHYDYIIAGAGCAGLSLAYSICKSHALKNKKVLLIDADNKTKNDRTWCFWEKEVNQFEHIVSKKWNSGSLFSFFGEKKLIFKPYTYKMIKGVDFYVECFSKINKNPNIHFLQTQVNEIQNNGIVKTDLGTFSGNLIFNSIYQKPDDTLLPNHYFLLQHFEGWMIETENEVFDPNQITFMDFRIEQNGEVRFFYVLPFSKKSALIEFTVFSEKILEPEIYKNHLEFYINNQLKIKNYKISHSEFGIIPMTDFPFKLVDGKQIFIGSQGGASKASSGYTFTFIQKKINDIIFKLENEEMFVQKEAINRYALLDSTLLSVLKNKLYPGDKYFTELFLNNSVKSVFAFLNEESNMYQEIKLMMNSPKSIFSKVLKQEFINKKHKRFKI